MEILVFKTNIHQRKDIRKVGNIFKKEKDILTWNVDTGDVDKVLRIEAVRDISHTIENVVSKAGFFCKTLD